MVNQRAIEVLFTHRQQEVLTVLPADYDAEPTNFDAAGKLHLDRPARPAELPIFVGMRVVLTKNLNKANHFVNGMVAEVEAWNDRAKLLRVRTMTGRRLAVWPFTDDRLPCGRVTYFPVRAGYAATVHKFQGAELEHVTLWLDRPGSPAAGYVGLSRVRKDTDYLVGGVVTRAHFVPAR